MFYLYSFPMSLFTELKRRKVIRVSIAYLVGAWLLLQLTEVLSELLTLPENIGPIVVTMLLLSVLIVLTEGSAVAPFIYALF